VLCEASRVQVVRVAAVFVAVIGVSLNMLNR